MNHVPIGMLRHIQKSSCHGSCGHYDLNKALSDIKAIQSLVFSAYLLPIWICFTEKYDYTEYTDQCSAASHHAVLMVCSMLVHIMSYNEVNAIRNTILSTQLCGKQLTVLLYIERYAVNNDIQYVADVWWQIGKLYVFATYFRAFATLKFKINLICIPARNTYNVSYWDHWTKHTVFHQNHPKPSFNYRLHLETRNTYTPQVQHQDRSVWLTFIKSTHTKQYGW